MSLEQRVMTLENQNSEISERLGGIEISVKNTQKDIQKLFLHSTKHEQAIESFRQETRERFDHMKAEHAEFRKETREQYEQITLLIRQLLPNKPN